MYTGPKLISKDLVFGYDTGYGVADNATATRFYPGEDTINLLNYDTTMPIWASDSSNMYSLTTKTSKRSFKVLGTSNVAGAMVFVYPSITTNTTLHTISATFTNNSTQTSSATLYIRGASNATSPVNQSSTYTLQPNETIRRTLIGNVLTNNGGYTAAVGIFSHTGSGQVNMSVTDIQFEEKTHATPFVNGTRSSTASLIDLKRTTSIDVDNVNFDSTGQPEFDGSDAYINVPYSSVLDTPVGATYELVFNPTGHGEMLSRGISDSGTSPDNPRIYWGTNGSIYFDWSIYGQDTYVVTSAADCPASQYSYIACTALPGQQLRVYVNGVEATYTSNVQTLPTPIPNTNHPIVIGGCSWIPRYFAGKIPVVKLHKRALTLSEIKENFKAYKNRFNI